MLDGFLAGPENRLAAVAAASVGDRHSTYNPLVFFGPTGTGKSHLALGLAALWIRQHPQQQAIVTTGADFARDYARALKTDTLCEFRSPVRSAALLVLDGLGELTGKAAAQQELVHSLDAVGQHGGRMILTAGRLPTEMTSLLPALRSRLCAGLTVPLQAPGPHTRLVILQQLAALLRVALSEQTARVIADAMPLTVPLLHSVLLDLLMATEGNRRNIDCCTASRYIADRTASCRPSISSIISSVAKYFSIKVTDLKGPSRRQAVVHARGAAILLARQLTGKSMASIGRHFGRRDPTTVLHACRTTEKRIRTDPVTSYAVEELRDLLTTI